MITPDMIISRLKSSNLWNKKTKERNGAISYLTCPECLQPEAYFYSTAQWTVKCSRKKKCGARSKVTTLFPDLITRIERDFPPTKTDPNLPARTFLLRRGLLKSIEGLEFKYQKNIRKLNRGGVLFYIGKNKSGKEVWNGRIFDPPPGERKGAGYGEQDDLFWMHPGVEYDYDKDTLVTEGVIDALSWIEMGYQAIAILTSGRKPTTVDLTKFTKLIFAFDYDKAGWEAHQAWREAFPKANNIAIPMGWGDANDLIINMGIDKATEYVKEKWEFFEHHGRLALCKTAGEYAKEFYNTRGYSCRLFDFGGAYYYSNVKKKGDKPPEFTTYPVSDFTVNVEHFQLDNTDEEEPTYKYHIRITTADDNRETTCTVTARDLSTPAQLTQLFLQRARAVWWGTGAAVVELQKLIARSRSPIVKQMNVKGHDEKSGYYVFQNFAISPTGSIILPNDKGILELSQKSFVRPARLPDIQPTIGPGGKSLEDIYSLMFEAWGEKALFAMSWAVASWFVNDIKERLKFFPILSLYNHPGTGKSNMVMHLNAMQCIDEEGVPLKDINTGVGMARTMSQRSGLFQALLEGKRNTRSRFDYRMILTVYNDAPLQIKGMKSNDTRTDNLAFKGAIMFVQNKEPFEEKEEMERVISLPFYKDDLSRDSKEAFDGLLDVPKGDFAKLYLRVMQQNEKVRDEWHKEFLKARSELTVIKDNRINENHAIVLAFHRIMVKILGIDHDILAFTKSTAMEKEMACNKNSGPIANYFFDIIRTLYNGNQPKEFWKAVTYEKSKGHLRVHLPSALKVIKQEGYPLSSTQEALQEALLTHPAFMRKGSLRFLGPNTSVSANAFQFNSAIVQDEIGEFKMGGGNYEEYN